MSRSCGLTVLLIGCPEPVVGAVRAGGHRTVAESEPAAGMVQARYNALDVVILDLARGGDDPFALARGIRAITHWRKPMVLALTETTEGMDGPCREAGIDLLLVKPVAPVLVTEFLERLTTVVQDYESFDPAI